MKIGFPIVEEQTSVVADGFHGSDRLGVINLLTKEISEYSIAELEKKTGDDNLCMILAGLEISTVVCKKMQPMALKFFSDNRILVYQAANDDINDNIELLKEGKLQRFTANMTTSSGCGSSCSSSSSCSSCSSIADDIEYL